MGHRYSKTTGDDEIILQESPGQQNNDQIHDPHRGAGHHNEEQNCQWGIGWKTTSMICGFYALGLIIAIIHLVVFAKYLDGKYEDDPNVPSQSHVTAASTIMANVVGLCIRICLAAVFTQYFWRVVRLSPLRLDTVELLYSLRNNPSSLGSLNVYQKGWLLVIIATILWVIPIAMSFPPSAITVHHAESTVSGLRDGLPGFNLSNTWHDNSTTVRMNSMFVWDTVPERHSEAPGRYGLDSYVRSPVRQLATNVMMNAAFKTMPSPCGLNCSYPLSFIGPYLTCNYTRYNTTTNKRAMTSLGVLDNKFEIFAANWTTLEDPYNENSGMFENFQVMNNHAGHLMNHGTTSHDGVGFGFGNITFYYTQEHLFCTPRRAEYHVVLRFFNGEQSVSLNIGEIHNLKSFNNTTVMPDHNISAETAIGVRDNNIMAMIMAMTRPLVGYYLGQSFSNCQNAGPCDMSFGPSSRPQNGTLVEFTPVADEFHYSLAWYYERPDAQKPFKSLFTVNEALLNAFLANITLSAISHFNFWPTTANVTSAEPRSQYSFSQPLNLILPYFLTLATCLPLVALGLFALQRNGVPATDGGFLQILVTTRGSQTLDNLAAGGCLGGDQNIPSQLKDLEVRFGELIESDKVERDEIVAGTSDIENDNSLASITGQEEMNANDGVFNARQTALAGFGPKDQVLPLEVGKQYGAVS